ncbi:hypothetical protein B0O99DRAFT_680210 [Bisporella sp. PMI_857]|nr:hypothetical protein B0O99DRAFT_680210 [Bisporella sp. PMI_857]
MHLLEKNSAQMEEPYFGLGDFYYSLLFSITDASLILGFAYIANFVMKGKCTMSTYHYYVSLDSILFVCSTLVASFATLRDRYFRTLAGFLRFILTLVLFGFIGFFLGYQVRTHAMKDFPEWNMGKLSVKGRNDSAILLPVSCFFDPDLIEQRSPFTRNGTTPLLTTAQIHLIGAPVKNISVPEIWIYLFMVLAFFVAFFAQICWCCCGRRTGDQKSRKGGCRWYIFLYWFFILMSCFITNSFCVWHINTSRAWVKGSGWMKDKSEDEWFALGQLLPVMALFYIIAAVADIFKFRKCGQRRGKGNSRV